MLDVNFMQLTMDSNKNKGNAAFYSQVISIGSNTGVHSIMVRVSGTHNMEGGHNVSRSEVYNSVRGSSSY